MGPHQQHVDAGHGRNSVQIFIRLYAFNLHNQHRLIVGRADHVDPVLARHLWPIG